ncbi:D-lactate dehydrogenase [cytochrome], mitochondrial [Vitis vinifera]|uniref:D-lactate dehydrogenase [cytochrome], mitochondrial n=1 Tax=Vitis vinifera TaxID=29760 RepID=A0A438DSH4_VITVI|nr:D-lactate dehydrogenase [cytochrome], mitochondrial [Vitis vinifera]
MGKLPTYLGPPLGASFKSFQCIAEFGVTRPSRICLDGCCDKSNTRYNIMHELDTELELWCDVGGTTVVLVKWIETFSPSPVRFPRCFGALSLLWTMIGFLFLACRYGTMRDNVINLKVVLANGDVVKTGSRARKSAAGCVLSSFISCCIPGWFTFRGVALRSRAVAGK